MTMIKVGGDAEKSTGQFIFPIMSAPVGIFFTNTDAVKLKCNFAINQLTAAISGTLNPGQSSTVMGSGHVQTDITETDNMTIFAVYKHPVSLTSSGAMIVSTYRADPSSYGCGLFVSQSGVNFIATQMASSGNLTAGGQPVQADGWTMVVGRVSKNNNYIKNLTTGAQKTTNYAGRQLGSSPKNFKIGGSYETAYRDSVEIMSVVIFDKALSDNDIATVAQTLRQYASKHRVSV